MYLHKFLGELAKNYHIKIQILVAVYDFIKTWAAEVRWSGLKDDISKTINGFNETLHNCMSLAKEN